jgi:hypothetical protein
MGSQPDNGNWVIVKAEGSAGTAVYRVRTDEPRNQQDYPINISIRYPYVGDTTGFPTEAEQSTIDAFEDLLSELMWPPGPSCLVFAVTGFQAREWQFQANSYCSASVGR